MSRSEAAGPRTVVAGQARGGRGAHEPEVVAVVRAAAPAEAP